MQLKIEKGTFKDYSLKDTSDALRKGLSENFKKVRFSKMSGKHFPNSPTHRGAWAFSNWFMGQN